MQLKCLRVSWAVARGSAVAAAVCWPIGFGLQWARNSIFLVFWILGKKICAPNANVVNFSEAGTHVQYLPARRPEKIRLNGIRLPGVVVWLVGAGVWSSLTELLNSHYSEFPQ